MADNPSFLSGFFTNAKYAIGAACARSTDHSKPIGVAYRLNRGWFCYDLRDGKPGPNDEPEFICIRGNSPLPLNETAFETWWSILKSLEGDQNDS